MQDILKSSEHEKIELIAKMLSPTIAMNLSFDQDKELDEILENILLEKSIHKAEIVSEKYNKKMQTEIEKHEKRHLYKHAIPDPFDSSKNIAELYIEHSFEHLGTLYEKINRVLLLIFLFALMIFFTFYLAMKKELNSLKIIAEAFSNYTANKQIPKIQTQSKTQEIQIIASTANEMIAHISSYLLRLERFNTDLEHEVQEKVAKLRSQEKMMIHQSRQAAMGEMLESIAHQWRQPLNIIGIACVNLELEHDLGTQTVASFKDKLQIITKNINYMSNTIDDFREFLNPKQEAQKFNPHKTIEDVYDILKAQLSNNKIRFTLSTDSAHTPYLYGIENEFKQVIFILLNNSKDAIKSMQKNFENFQGEIEVKIQQQEDRTLIAFCDNGGGIKEDIIHSIFEPYFTTKFASSGTGIGLYMAKNIIESRMHGHLSVKNTKTGCCFTIEQRIQK